MAARASDRLHVRQVELALETNATGRDLEDLVERFRANHNRTATFLRALVDAHSEAAALRALLEARADHLIDVGAELAGLLDGVTGPLDYVMDPRD